MKIPMIDYMQVADSADIIIMLHNPTRATISKHNWIKFAYVTIVSTSFLCTIMHGSEDQPLRLGRVSRLALWFPVDIV